MKLLNRLYSLILFCVILLLAFTINQLHPSFFSNENQFIKEYISSPILATMGFIVSITLAGINSLYVNLQRLGKELGIPFSKTKRSLKASAFTLIILFCVTLTVVILKHSSFTGNWENILNITALACLYMNISVLFDVTNTALSLPDP